MGVVKNMVQGLPGQFLIGGLTVAGISHFSKGANPILAGIIAAVPIGMPSSVFVPDAKVATYATNLLIMSSALIACTLTNWFFITRLKWSKYKSVGASLVVFLGGALLASTYIHKGK